MCFHEKKDEEQTFFLDLVGDAYDGSNALVPDNDPLDNCSSESHGTYQLFFLPSVILFLLTYFIQVHMFLELLLQTPLESIRISSFLKHLSLVLLHKSHLECVSSSDFHYSKLISLFLFSSSSKRSCVRMYWRWYNRYVLNYSLLTIIFFFLTKHCFICVDTVTAAIYRAYNDSVDISECLHLILSIESFNRYANIRIILIYENLFQY